MPANKGHEAMPYLSFIIDNYDKLPEYVIFTHGERHSWHHEGDMAGLIDSLRLPVLKDHGYISLRCDWYPSCPREIRPISHDVIVWGAGVNREATEYVISLSWKDLFPNEALPETIASHCCAQFAVTRQAIRRRPKSDYERMRRWILDSELPDDVTGRVLEKIWAYIFTGESVRCPSPNRCSCEFFGQCGPKQWLQTPEGLPDLPEW
ncbi:uncharacterized protein LTHEOB_7289 [Lasiodiplodia theobromae]|nr:uncharacterized protein LTHEOB_7289 [Lasiodiplodia theobromae]KAF4542559.1 hypothetical protein LTHEOB_7289 [Lasiodiplodia theobromae]